MVCSDASRKWLRAIGTLGAGLAVMLGPRRGASPRPSRRTPSGSRSRATARWRPIRRATSSLRRSTSVGDGADPAAYVFMDTAWLYLRLRMNATVLQNATTYEPYAWACLVRTAGTPGSYLVWDGVDGLASPTDVELLAEYPSAARQPDAATCEQGRGQLPDHDERAPGRGTEPARGRSGLLRRLGGRAGGPGQRRDHAVDAGEFHLRNIEDRADPRRGRHRRRQGCGGVLDAVECVGGQLRGVHDRYGVRAELRRVRRRDAGVQSGVRVLGGLHQRRAVRRGRRRSATRDAACASDARRT